MRVANLIKNAYVIFIQVITILCRQIIKGANPYMHLLCARHCPQPFYLILFSLQTYEMDVIIFLHLRLKNGDAERLSKYSGSYGE